MSLDKAKEYFKTFGIEDKVLEFDQSSATVELAAQAVGCEPARIAKTLSFLIDEQPILIVTAGDARIDNRKYKDHFGKKAKMISPDKTEELIGHTIGGICPFGIKDGVEVYLDDSLKRFRSVFPACGSANSAIELTIPELEKYSPDASWIDVCKNWE